MTRELGACMDSKFKALAVSSRFDKGVGAVPVRCIFVSATGVWPGDRNRVRWFCLDGGVLKSCWVWWGEPKALEFLESLLRPILFGDVSVVE